jgi:hypothetical protein
VEIRWPSGAHESYQNLPAGYIYTIVEGGGVQQKLPFSIEKDAKP